ncbi:MAG: cysteine desulfurase-like protein [Phycisphaerales bacterium]|nr:MAG: cysteine desulfurase-like protein [Phycisphaerales bacterium]
MSIARIAAESIDVDRIRSSFPALASDTVFLENAGGSQVPAVVADAMHRYLLNTYVQLGAGYELATECDRVIERAHEFINLLVNGANTGTVILGPSCSQLCAMLAHCYGETLDPGDEIIVTEAGHEANVGPWVRLAESGFTVRTWKLDPQTFTCPPEDLRSLLTERTKVVAIVHVSNLLGEIVNVKEIAEMVHSAGARLVVDGVAYAPHRAIDVADWNVDWYAFSTYKVYGPHMAALYGKRDAIAELTGPNHFFIPRKEVPHKFELGGVNHEGCAGLNALGDYFRFLARFGDTGLDEEKPIDRRTIEDAFAVMAACELPVQRHLIEYLLNKPSVRIIGPPHWEPARVGTVSFAHQSRSSAEIAAAAHRKNIGIRNGHMYAYRLCEALGMDPEDGVVRVSLVHYNTVEEIDRLIEILETVL